jgi:hypothetical protein
MAASGNDPIASRAAVRLLDSPGDPWPGGLAGRLPPNALPREITSFIGRDRQIADLARELLGTRLLTLIGPGGVGKTRLALELAEHQQANFADGACFVSLAGIAEPAMVP